MKVFASFFKKKRCSFLKKRTKKLSLFKRMEVGLT